MKAPVLYHVDRHGAFNGVTSLAQLSPGDVAQGATVWLIPEGATTQEPTAANRGEVALLRGDAWSVVPDHRGRTVYDKTTQASLVVEQPGAIDGGFTMETPPSPYHTWLEHGWELVPENVPVPAFITASQLIRELAQHDLLDAVDAVIAKADALTQRLWERAAIFERRDPLVIVIAGALGRDTVWLDDFFRTASCR